MEDAELKHLFNKATDFVKASTDKLDASQLLYLYARYKQVHEGKCDTQRPGFFDFKGKQKWDVWYDLKDMQAEEAMAQYVGMIDTFDSEWLEKMDSGAIVIRTGLGVGISTPSRTSKPVQDDHKTIFDWCKDNNLSRVESMLSANAIDQRDDMGLCLLHWASDSGFTDMVKLILDHRSDVNVKDNEGQTALHYAVSCGHLEVVKLLLEHGSDASITDNDRQTALDLYDKEFDPDIEPLLKQYLNTIK